MKHSFKVTLILIAIFLISQVFGLCTYSLNLPVLVNETTGEVIKAEQVNTSLLYVPETTAGEQFGFVAQIIIGVLIATGIIFLLRYFKLDFLFRYWFLFAVFASLALSLHFYLKVEIALVLALLLSLWKVFRPNIFIHNITEIMIYTGIAIALAEFLDGNIIAVFLLLALISIYDMIAVWQSKHMVKLASIQTEAGVFAGLSIPYTKNRILSAMVKQPKNIKNIKEKIPSAKGVSAVPAAPEGEKVSNAILGGGDIAFPLLFTAVALKSIINAYHIPALTALVYSLGITLFATVSLAILLFKAEKGKFYPAMPFLSLGCSVGYGFMILLLQLRF